MRKTLLSLMLIALAAQPVFAVEYEGIELQYGEQMQIGGARRTAAVVISPAYSNVTNFSGTGYSQGGATLQAGNTITKLIADDLTPLAALGGGTVSDFKFVLVNFNSVPVTFRPRARFWYADGAGGLPGTYYNQPAVVGFTFNPVVVNAGTATIFTAPLVPGSLNMPGVTFWAGMTFDDNFGATGATAAQLNLIGMGIFDPPVIGTSTDQIFQTNLAGSFFPTPNPAGVTLNFSGNPPANLGWEFNVDQTTSGHTTTWGRLKSLYR